MLGHLEMMQAYPRTGLHLVLVGGPQRSDMHIDLIYSTALHVRGA